MKTTLFDYCMHSLRDKIGGSLLASATGDAQGALSHFDEPDGVIFEINLMSTLAEASRSGCFDGRMS